jgi:DNA-binding response OmpR family regulator
MMNINSGLQVIPNDEELRVMVVDDDPVWTSMMKEALSHASIEFECITDSREALSEALRFNPNIILLDFNMPNLSGKDVTEQLAGNPITRTIAVAFVTASENILDVMHGLTSHLVNVYTKPVAIGDLLEDIVIRHWWVNQKSQADKLQRTAALMTAKYGDGCSHPVVH